MIMEWVKQFIPHIIAAIIYVVTMNTNQAVLTNQLSNVSVQVDEIKEEVKGMGDKVASVEREATVARIISEGNSKAIDQLYAEVKRGH